VTDKDRPLPARTRKFTLTLLPTGLISMAFCFHNFHAFEVYNDSDFN
jgi:hypothetical protein